jgi:nitrate reductase NapD
MPSSRRAFIQGQWNPGYPDVQGTSGRQVEIVSLIVCAFPQHLDAVADAILALGSSEIHGRDAKGRLIVVIEEASQGAAGAKANAISNLRHVLSATMVFQGSDNDEAIG